MSGEEISKEFWKLAQKDKVRTDRTFTLPIAQWFSVSKEFKWISLKDWSEITGNVVDHVCTTVSDRNFFW